MGRRAREQQAARIRQAEQLAETQVCTIVRLTGEVDALREALKTKPTEAALKAELHRLTKAYAALEEELLTVQKSNEVQARELRAIAEKTREATA